MKTPEQLRNRPRGPKTVQDFILKDERIRAAADRNRRLKVEYNRARLLMLDQFASSGGRPEEVVPTRVAPDPRWPRLKRAYDIAFFGLLLSGAALAVYRAAAFVCH